MICVCIRMCFGGSHLIINCFWNSTSLCALWVRSDLLLRRLATPRGMMPGPRAKRKLFRAKSPLRGRDHRVTCLPVRGCRSPHGSVSACSPDNAQLSEPTRVQAKTEFARVLRPPDGITEHTCDENREELDLDVGTFGGRFHH